MGWNAHIDYVDQYSQWIVLDRNLQQLIKIAKGYVSGSNILTDDFSTSVKNRFIDKVCQKAINDLGNKMHQAAARILSDELSRFIAIHAFDIHKSYIRDISNSLYFPPPNVDQVWKLMILDTRKYEKMWIELWGKYIDRVDPLFAENQYLPYKYFTYLGISDGLISKFPCFTPMYTRYVSLLAISRYSF